MELKGVTCRHDAKSINFKLIKRKLRDQQVVVCEAKSGTSMATACGRSCHEATNEQDGDDRSSEQYTVHMCLQCGHQGCGAHADNHVMTPHSDSHCLAVDVQRWIVRCLVCRRDVSVTSGKALDETVRFIRKHNAARDARPKRELVEKQQCDSATPASDMINVSRVYSTVYSTQAKGLVNVGNTCYLNAVLQCLCRCRPFCRQLTTNSLSPPRLSLNDTDGSLVELSVDGTAGALTSAVCVLLAQMGCVDSALVATSVGACSNHTATVSPAGVLDQISRKFPQFAGHEQQDSHELLRTLMEGLRQEEIKRCQSTVLRHFQLSSKVDPATVDEAMRSRLRSLGKQLNHTVVDSVFRGQLISIVVCQSCNSISHHCEPFFDLSLPIIEEKPALRRKNAEYRSGSNGAPATSGELLKTGRHKRKVRGKVRGRRNCVKPTTEESALKAAEEHHEVNDSASAVSSLSGSVSRDGDVEDNQDDVCDQSLVIGSLFSDAEESPDGASSGARTVRHVTKRELSPAGLHSIVSRSDMPDSDEQLAGSRHDDDVNGSHFCDESVETGGTARCDASLANGFARLAVDSMSERATSHAYDQLGDGVAAVENDTPAPAERDDSICHRAICSDLLVQCDVTEQTGASLHAAAACSSTVQCHATRNGGATASGHRSSRANNGRLVDGRHSDDISVNYLMDDIVVAGQAGCEAVNGSVDGNFPEHSVQQGEQVADDNARGDILRGARTVFEHVNGDSGDYESVQQWCRQALVTLASSCSREGGRQSPPAGTVSAAGVSGTGSTVASALNAFTATELLSGANRLVCERCTALLKKTTPSGGGGCFALKAGGYAVKGDTVYSSVSKQLLVYSPPGVLTLHLKRFEVCAGSLKKLNRPVEFDLLFDLAPYCSSVCQELPHVYGERLWYSLFAVVEHSGRINSGHYTAYVRVPCDDQHLQHDAFLTPPVLPPSDHNTKYKSAASAVSRCTHRPKPATGRWYYVSDTHVQQVNEQRVLSCQAYILFYERLT